MASSIVKEMQILISATTKGLNTAISQATGAFKTFETAVNKTNNILQSFGVGFALYKITGVLTDAVGTLADFGQQMAEVRALTGATDDEFAKLTDSAKALGASTKFTASEIGSLQANLARLGFSTNEILQATEGITKLAVATGEDLAKSADVVGSTLRSFGLEATQTQRVVDVMAESFNKSALGLENFTEAIKFVAPIAAQAGLSIEETTALLGTLADNGIRGSLAGTSLRKIITDLGTESGDLSERLKKLAARGLTGADAMSEVGRTAYASLLILAQNADKTDALANGLNNAAGAAEKAAAIMGDTLAGDLDKLSSAYDGLILSQAEADGTLRTVTQAATGFLNAVADKDNAFGKFLDKFLDLITVVPRAAKAVSDFFTGEGLSADELNEKLVELNRIRDFHKQHGNRESEKAVIREIAELTNQYNLLKPAVDESNKVIATSSGEVKKLGDALVPPVGLIQQLEDKIKVFEEAKKAAFSVSEINEFNEKIGELKDQLAVLNASRELSTFGQLQFDNASAGLDTSINPIRDRIEALSNISGGTQEPLFQLPLPDADAHIEAIGRITDAYLASAEAQRVANVNIKNDQIEITDRQRLMAQTAFEFGQSIADAAVRGKSMTQVLLQAVASAAQKFIAFAFKEAIAGTIAGAAKTKAPPPVILALAAAGIAGISALFAKIGGSSGGISAGGAGGAGRTVSNVSTIAPVASQSESQTVTFRLEGPDLAATMNTNNGRINNRLGG